jgi:hypothetical protein
MLIFLVVAQLKVCSEGNGALLNVLLLLVLLLL